jgi:hypothetical protein
MRRPLLVPTRARPGGKPVEPSYLREGTRRTSVISFPGRFELADENGLEFAGDQLACAAIPSLKEGDVGPSTIWVAALASNSSQRAWNVLFRTSVQVGQPSLYEQVV